MKYFTADRYNNGQSIDDDAADKDWEEQLRLYGERLKEIDNKLPESVKQFMKTCCLHDADIDQCMDFGIGLSAPRRLQLVIRQRDQGDHKFVCVLRYKMALPGHLANLQGYQDYQDLVDTENHRHPCFMTQEQYLLWRQARHAPAVNSVWLYDEFDYLGTVVGNDIFTHNILFSCGLELKIVFSEFHFMFLPIGDGFIEF
jgi:hypothetical protein